MINTSAIDPHWPVDTHDAAREQPSLPLDSARGRYLRAQLQEAPDVGREFAILRELRRRRQARTVTRKDHK